MVVFHRRLQVRFENPVKEEVGCGEIRRAKYCLCDESDRDVSISY